MASFRTAVDCNTNVANSIKIQNLDARITEAVELLKQLIATPSRSRDEARTADLLHAFLAQRGAAPERRTMSGHGPRGLTPHDRHCS